MWGIIFRGGGVFFNVSDRLCFFGCDWSSTANYETDYCLKIRKAKNAT